VRALVIARWEYLEKVKSKAFLISLILMPVIMFASGVLPTLLATRPDNNTRIVGVIDRSGELFQPLMQALDDQYRLPNGQPNYLLRLIAAGHDLDIQSAKKEGDDLILSESIEGYILIGQNPSVDTTIEYHSMNVGNIRLTERLTSRIRDIIVERKLKANGLSPTLVKQLTAPVEMKTIKLSKSGKEEESGFEKVFITSYIFMMMMFFLVMTSGQLLVRSMLEEKSSRVVEVLMSSGSAGELMAGKIIGLSGLGLTQLGVWVTIGILISLNFAVTTLPLASALVMLPFFILGYLLFAAIFVAAGAPVSTEQEAQQITSYLVMILIIPIVFAFMVVQNPNSTLVRVLSFIPVLTPSMMAMRIPIQMPSAGEIISSLLLLALSVLGAMWIAGKVFRATILLYGKRPGLKELVTLIRAH
jgi:ABC-2 type transport system permease protein